MSRSTVRRTGSRWSGNAAHVYTSSPLKNDVGVVRQSVHERLDGLVLRRGVIRHFQLLQCMGIYERQLGAIVVVAPALHAPIIVGVNPHLRRDRIRLNRRLLATSGISELTEDLIVPVESQTIKTEHRHILQLFRIP